MSSKSIWKKAAESQEYIMIPYTNWRGQQQCNWTCRVEVRSHKSCKVMILMRQDRLMTLKHVKNLGLDILLWCHWIQKWIDWHAVVVHNQNNLVGLSGIFFTFFSRKSAVDLWINNLKHYSLNMMKLIMIEVNSIRLINRTECRRSKDLFKQ